MFRMLLSYPVSFWLDSGVAGVDDHQCSTRQTGRLYLAAGSNTSSSEAE